MRMSEQIPQSKKQFEEMEREWTAIGRRELARLMDAWQARMAATAFEYESLVARGLWVSGHADFLGVIHRQRDELAHSRLLAWLLTPTARHGLGSALLSRLLEYCRESPTLTPPFVRAVTCEYTRNTRRADIIVWGDDFTLVIENKVDADEQPDQCDDLYANFKNEPGSTFVFLTPHGGVPRTATTSEAYRAFVPIAWSEVREMIEDAMTGSAPRNPRSALAVVQNYVVTLREQFG